MLERRRRLDLGDEAVGAEDGGQLGLEDLDGDVALVLEIAGEEHRGHATLAQLALQAVAAGQRAAESIRHTIHGRSSALAHDPPAPRIRAASSLRQP